MFWFNFKNTELPEEIKDVEVFNSKLKELMDSDNYISRKDYMFLFEEHEKTYNSLCAIKNAGLLKSYCKKNKISENMVIEFISNYSNLKDVVSNRNKSFVQRRKNRLNHQDIQQTDHFPGSICLQQSFCNSGS